ncbi:MAG: PQQ-binding-like beta-propeller repeat protein, partial [Planctomycetota bacterium]
MHRPTLAASLRGRSGLTPGATLAVALILAASVAEATDWPTWRGPNGDGTSAETDLVTTWKPAGGEGSNVLWASEALAGRSTPVVLDGRLYTLVRDRPGSEQEGEKVVCVDAATGEERWTHRFNVYLSDVPDTRVGWSSVCADPETGRVYAQGVCGYFVCLDGKSGDVVWSRSLHEELGLLSTYGGRTGFPLIHDDTVITSAVVIGWGDSPKWGLLAKPAHRFLAFGKATGELRWLSGTRLIPYDTTYSTPAQVTLAGQRALVFGSGDGAVWAMQAGTGKLLWKHQLSRRGLNVSPVVDDQGRVFTSHSEENPVGNAMGALVALDGTRVGDGGPTDLSDSPLWKNYQVMAGKSSPLVIGDRLYVVNDSGKLLVFDTASGEQLDRKSVGRVMRGSPIFADGKIYACSRGGTWRVFEPTGSGVKQVARVQLRREQVDASPIVANGRLYLTTSARMYCLGNEASIAANPPAGEPAPPADKPTVKDKRVAQVQLVPWDVLLAPGEEHRFRLRLYNAAGEFLREAKPGDVSFGASGPGDVSPEGVYRAPTDAGHQVALVLCEYKGRSAEARVRIVPPLPWSFDFEGKADKPPLTWVGGRIRYVRRAGEDGGHYLAKPTELPTRPGRPSTKLGTRSRMWMGPSDLTNYTVQADVQLRQGVAGEASADDSFDGGAPDGPPAAATAIKLPTAGLINSRYTFALF